MRNFNTVVAPLSDLLKGKKGRNITLNFEAWHAFQHLKEAFTSVPILKLPDPNKSFVVNVDTSEIGIGVVLSEHHSSPPKLHPCVFFSRKLLVERSYDIGKPLRSSQVVASIMWDLDTEAAQRMPCQGVHRAGSTCRRPCAGQW